MATPTMSGSDEWRNYWLQSPQRHRLARPQFLARFYQRLRIYPCCSSFVSFWFQGPALFAFCHAIAEGRH